MLKNNSNLQTKSKAKPKSTARRPLRDFSNGVKLQPKSCVQKKFSGAHKKEKEEEKGHAGNGDGSIDRLLLIHSDLSSLVHQIDELIVQALKLTGKEGMKEIDAFANALSEMQTSLEPWIPRFQKALSNSCTGPQNLVKSVATAVGPVNCMSTAVESPVATKLDELVSPSPLVSWRADCAAQGGRQLFLLTPLHRQKKQQANMDVRGETKRDLPEVVPPRPTTGQPVSPETVAKMARCMLVMTPCIKMSPPKSCVLLEPISQFPQKNSQGVRKATPFLQISKADPCQDCESSYGQVSVHKKKSISYPDFLGIRVDYNYGNRKQAVEESPNWLLSPPKTCVLMEPPDKEPLDTTFTGHQLPKFASISKQMMDKSLAKENNIQDGQHKQGLGIESVIVENTPMLLESACTIRTGKQKGENTLKKELWTKFDAVSKTGIHCKDSTLQKLSGKGFLDLLDEVS